MWSVLMAWWATANHQDKDATPHHNPIILSDRLCHVVHVTSFPFVAQRGKNASPQDKGDHYEWFYIYWCTFLKMLKEEKVKRHSLCCQYVLSCIMSHLHTKTVYLLLFLWAEGQSFFQICIHCHFSILFLTIYCSIKGPLYLSFLSHVF